MEGTDLGFNTEQPIYLQIGMDIKEQIVSRKLAPGEKLRSEMCIRDRNRGDPSDR